MDEGLPESWKVLDPGTAVFASDGSAVGEVKEVLGVQEEDIFEGIIVTTGRGDRFVRGEQVGSIHERGVDLKLDAAAAAALGEPEPAPAAMQTGPDDASEREVGYKTGIWVKRIWNRLSGKY